VPLYGDSTFQQVENFVSKKPLHLFPIFKSRHDPLLEIEPERVLGSQEDYRAVQSQIIEYKNTPAGYNLNR